MDLQQIVIPKDEAEAKLAEYEGLIADERTAEDKAIAQAYRAATRGLGVISLPRTIASGGFHGNSLPRLGVARADDVEVYARWSDNAVIYSDYDRWDVNRGALVGAHSVRVALAGDELPPRKDRKTWSAGIATVPIVPPRFRPRLRRLHGFHLLWEVPEWKRIPPVDPALIRHIRGDLWSVVAVWDLTGLEQLVLSQR
jgi:hypothetical protein